MKNKKHKLLKLGSIGLLASVFGLAVVGYASKDNYYQPVKAEETPTYLEYSTNEKIYEYSQIVFNFMQSYEGMEEIYMRAQFNEQQTYNEYSLAVQNTQEVTGIANEGQASEISIAFYEDENQPLIIGEEEATYVKIYQQNTDQNLYTELVEAEQPTTPTTGQVGSSIINAIKSGLGLIGDLASQFLIGFSTLFWNATTQALTPFGMFALVMLGVSITFAVIKLVLNVLRSNTGA